MAKPYEMGEDEFIARRETIQQRKESNAKQNISRQESDFNPYI